MDPVHTCIERGLMNDGFTILKSVYLAEQTAVARSSVAQNSVVYKPNGQCNAPFHQDFIPRLDEPLKLIAWTALEPVTVATGAMEVIARSHHNNGLLPGYRPRLRLWRRLARQLGHRLLVL